MRVGIEAQRLRNPYSGLGQFCQQLGQHLVQQTSEIDWTFVVPHSKKGVFGETHLYQSPHFYHKFWPDSLYHNTDLVHITHQDSSFIPHRSPFVLTIHDLNFLERSDYSWAKKKQKLAQIQGKINKAEVLTAISEYTKTTVERHLNTQHKVFEVVYNGCNALLPPTMPVGNWQRPFVFSLGIIQAKKNFHVLLPLLAKFPEYDWVIAGDDTDVYASFLRTEAQKLGIANRLYLMGRVSEGEKSWLYQHCTAFWFPSLAEGFGLPVVEAMSMGKPVFLSRLTSLPEVGGPDAFYFDTFEPKHLISVFEQGMNRVSIHLSDCLKAWAAGFSWQATAQAYIRIYQQYQP